MSMEQRLQYIRSNLPFYAKNYIRIRPKKGGTSVPLIFNTAQMLVHNFIEDIVQAGQPVRVVICKGRQMGVSTYTASRFLWKSTLNPGTSVFILAHISKSTDYLFDMVKRMYNNLPVPLQPEIDRSNKKELKFGKLDSEYGLGTAGAKDVGRGMNPHLLHLSEIGFYDNTEELSMGLLQGVATEPGTEIIAESTANGIGNMFYNLCMRGADPNTLSRYKTLFIPWYIQDEYRETPPARFRPNSEEQELMELYSLDIAQIFWRRRKLEDEYDNRKWRFVQEYPNTLVEAFVSSGSTLYKGEDVSRARKFAGVLEEFAPIIIGVDGSGRGKDKTAIVIRQGKRIVDWMTYDFLSPMDMAGVIAKLIDDLQADMVFIDIAYGDGAYSRLCEMGYGKKCMAIHFGSSPLVEGIYTNKRAEMYGNSADWLAGENISIPDDDTFANGLMMIPGFRRAGSRGLLGLPLKEEIREKNEGRSPDEADAFCLTFSFPVRGRLRQHNIGTGDTDSLRTKSPFKSRRHAQSFVAGGDKDTPSELFVRRK